MKACVFAFLFLLVASNVAYAHSPLISTSPLDGAVAAQPPGSIAFEFKIPVRLTKVTVQADSQSSEKLDLSDHKSFAKDLSLHLPAALGPGNYEIEWRGMAEDGHVMKGSFTFSVK